MDTDLTNHCGPLGMRFEEYLSHDPISEWPESLEVVGNSEGGTMDLFGSDDNQEESEHNEVLDKEEETKGNRYRLMEEEEVVFVLEEEEEEEDTRITRSASTNRDFGLSEDEELMFDLAVDPFLCGADDASQATLARAIEDLNNCINHLVISILSRFNNWTRSYYKSEFINLKNPRGDTGKKTPLLRAFFKLKKPRRLEMRRTTLEIHLKESILSTIYNTFFAGDVFFGVMDATQIKILDQMYYIMLEKNKPWTVVQRWRSISSAASIMPMDETEISNVVESVVEEIEQSITTFYPTENLNFHKKLQDVIRNTNGSSETMLKIVERAHKLSGDLQHDCVSARLKVTMAPLNELQGNRALLAFSPDLASSWAETSGRDSRRGCVVLSTVAFGLDSFEGVGNIRRVLMKPTVVTTGIFE